MSLDIEDLDRDEAAAREMPNRLKPLYRIAYADAPYHYDDTDADEFVDRMSSQLEREGFRLLLGTVDNALAGFAYGYVFPENLWWRGARSTPAPSLLTASKYAVVELVVDPAHRGNGYSHQLLNRLVDGRTEQVATLLAKPGALAHAMYERWGWVRAGEVQSYPHWPVDDAYLLPLSAPSLEPLLA